MKRAKKQTRFKLALDLVARGALREARAIFFDLHVQNPKSTEVLAALAKIAIETGELAEARGALSQLTLLMPQVNEYRAALARVLINLRDFRVAIKVLEPLCQAQPNDADLLNALAICHCAVGDFSLARNYYSQAIDTGKNLHLSLSNLSELELRVGDCSRARQLAEEAHKLLPLHSGLQLALCNALNGCEDFSACLSSVDVYLTRGGVLTAEISVARARANASLKLLKVAETELLGVISTHGGHPTALRELLLLLSEQKRDAELLQFAIPRAKAIAKTDPNLYAWILSRMRRAGLANETEEIKAVDVLIERPELSLHSKTFHVFDSLFFLEDPEKIRRLSEVCRPSTLSAGHHVKSCKPQKGRVGFFSGDIRSHPVAQLSVDMFEALITMGSHCGFEYYLLSYGEPDNSELRKKLLRIFRDNYIELHGEKSSEIVKKTKGLKLEILIDMTGYTSESKTHLLANRLARAQGHWLGYPGTLGADFIDFIIGDEVVSPKKNQAHFTERVINLPRCYQPRSSLHSLKPNSMVGRGKLKPEKKILCCYNKISKVTQKIISVWSEVLEENSETELHILASREILDNCLDNFEVPTHLRLRFVAADRLPLVEHLERLKGCYLAVDTYPYSSHTTASDALEAGVPLLTVIGDSFQSRVAASILLHLGLEELVASNITEYKSMLTDLVKNDYKVSAISKKIKNLRREHTFFKPAEFAKDFQDLLIKIQNLILD